MTVLMKLLSMKGCRLVSMEEIAGQFTILINQNTKTRLTTHQLSQEVASVGQ